ALAAGDVDVVDLYTTDSEIPYYHLRVLEDDRGHFPRYKAVLLYRLDLPERAPSALASLAILEGRIAARDMQRLNARATLDRVAEPVVAADFLAAALGMDAGTGHEGRASRVGHYVAEHMALVTASLFAAILVAIPLGVVAARRRKFGAAILGVAGIVQTIPS